MRPSPIPREKGLSRRVRLMLALAGFLLILGSVLLLTSLQQEPLREQLRYDPPATLFAPPQGDP